MIQEAIPAHLPEWLVSFGLADRVGTPDLFLSRASVLGVAHAAAMRVGFELGVNGYLCVGSVPTVVFLIRDRLDQAEVDRIHKALWNQGLASLLLLVLHNEIRVYSLWQRPIANNTHSVRNREQRLIEVLNLATDALSLLSARQLIASVESGQYFEEHKKKFDRRTRIDSTLLVNLRITQQDLVKQSLTADASRALLLQTIFIAYLEDRKIIEPEYYSAVLPGEDIHSFVDVLTRGDVPLLTRLFSTLREHFNGDIFYAPSSFDPNDHIPVLTTEQLAVLAVFRAGLVKLDTGQGRFWPYDFGFIPVELISAIYDRFLNDSDAGRRDSGAYYTPRFLADLSVDLAWQEIAARVGSPEPLRILDPACGSAIFLVRIFQRLVEEWRGRNPGNEPDWASLKAMLASLHGWDKQASAVRIGVFSLYVALLEQVHPPAIRSLMAAGKVLPELFGRTLREQDFFSSTASAERFDLIIGNPPWVSKKESAVGSARQWCQDHGYPMPNKELAWAFLWKASTHLASQGRAALLLPAMGIFLNHNREVEKCRTRWMEEVELLRVVNFADLRFQLFEGADRPTVLAVFRLPAQLGRDYRFDYWVPKANRLLSSARLLTIASVDQSRVAASAAKREPLFWKRRMWATGRDLKLLSWLTDLPALGGFARTFGRAKKRARQGSGEWVIGQGFQELHRDLAKGLSHGFKNDPTLQKYPFLETDKFRPWVIPTVNGPCWPTPEVRRAGFSEGYEGPHILIIKGVQQQEGVLRAAYVDQSLSFLHSIQSLRFPSGEENRAKLLTAVLNSRLAGWFYFHTTASLGAERPEVHQKQLLSLPFPAVEDVNQPDQARDAEKRIIELMNTLLARKDEPLTSDNWMTPYIEEANQLVYDYYGLTADERAVVEDGVNEVIPSVQPHRGFLTPLLKDSTEQERQDYAHTIVRTLDRWVEGSVHARLLEGKREWSLIELSLGSHAPNGAVQIEGQTQELMTALRKVMATLPSGSSHNVQLRPDFKVFLDEALFLIKPPDARFWLKSAALNDADEIAGELLLQQKRKVTREAGNGDHW